jgi:hypothetical protein
MKFLSGINVNTEYTLPIVDGNNGQVLTTDGQGAVYWGSISVGAINLDGLTDVVISSPTSGQILRYGIPLGSEDPNPVWYNWTPTYLTTSSSIDALGDVTILSAATGQLLRWNGSQWVNWTPNFLTSLPAHTHDDRYYTETEIDAFFGGEEEIAGYNPGNWDSAYSWGNHALAGYLTSFTETDPTVPAHVKAITTTDISNWNTAYGWGNHATQGYATQTWVGANYYNTGQIDDFFSGAEPISGYNKSNWDTAYGWGNHASAGYATQSYVTTAIANLVDSAPDTLDTLNELAAALGDDPNFATTVTNSIATKATYSSGRFQGDLNTLGISNASSGIYSIGAGYTNGPGNTNLYGTLYSFWNVDISVQIWPTYNGDFYWRKSVGASFANSVWRTIWDTSHFVQSDINNWNTAYNDRITAASVAGTGTKTLTLTQGDGGTITATWVDYDTDTDAQTLTWEAGTKTLGISGGNDITLDGLATEDFVTSQGYITSYTETDTLQSVVSRGRNADVGNSAYTQDGVYGATALPVTFSTPHTSTTRIGYTDAGGGQYAPTIGFLNTGDWSGFPAIRSRVNGESNDRFNIQHSGQINWGSGGASVPDTNLYRSAANTLRTDDLFVSSGGINTTNLVLTGSIAFTGGSKDIYGDGSGYLYFYGYNNVYFQNQITARAGINNDIGAVAINGNLYINTDTSRIYFQRPGGVVVGAIGWHSDDYYYVAGHPEYGPGAGNSVRVYGFGQDLHLGTNTAGDVATINNAGKFTYGGSEIATRSWVTSQGYLTSETDSQNLEWDGVSKNLTITNGNTVTLDGLLTNEDLAAYGYISSESDTLATVTARGATTSGDITVNGTLSTGNTIMLGYNVNGSVATTAFRGIKFHTSDDLNYYIGKPEGSWTQPLDIHFYTGIRLKSHGSYGGTRFINLSSGNTLMTVGDGTDYVRVTDRLQIGGATNIDGNQVWTSSGNLYFQYSGSGNIDMNYGGGYTFSHTSFRAPQFRLTDSANNARIIGGGDWGLKVQTDNGYIQIGPANDSYAHFYTDRPSFYFNKSTLYADGNIIWHAGNDGSGSGLDADTVDGYQASAFLYNQVSQLANTNLNDLTTQGVYHSSDQYGTNTNIPFANYFTMINLTNDAERQAQLWFGDTPGTMYWRPRQGPSTWHPWEKVWTTNSFSSTNVSNWNTAYGWGNHADYGYWNINDADTKNVQASSVRFVGDVEVQGTFTESSSIRFKENIKPLEPALGKVKQLNPVTYNKIGVAEEEIGLIAEEVAELFPEVVTYNEEGQVQGLNYSRLTVVLIKAIQELRNEVNELKNGK